MLLVDLPVDRTVTDEHGSQNCLYNIELAGQEQLVELQPHFKLSSLHFHPVLQAHAV